MNQPSFFSLSRWRKPNILDITFMDTPWVHPSQNIHVCFCYIFILAYYKYVLIGLNPSCLQLAVHRNICEPPQHHQRIMDHINWKHHCPRYWSRPLLTWCAQCSQDHSQQQTRVSLPHWQARHKNMLGPACPHAPTAEEMEEVVAGSAAEHQAPLQLAATWAGGLPLLPQSQLGQSCCHTSRERRVVSVCRTRDQVGCQSGLMQLGWEAGAFLG